MKLQIVLMRHATRSATFEFGQGESSLNAQGFAQAEELARQAQEQALKFNRPTQLLCSPKLRARQTLKPLAETLGLKIQIREELDERRDTESLASFENRVREIATHLKSETGVVVVCTHLDVLEAAAALWPTDLSEREAARPWSTLEYQVFQVNDSLFEAAARARIEPPHAIGT